MEFPKKQRASFGDLAFPITSCRMKGSYRHYEHVFLKTPGAAVEKLSRDLYRVDMAGVFDMNIQGYGDLSATIDALRRHYEAGTTLPLVIPYIGTVPCWIPEWDEDIDFKIRSGHKAQLVFMEDQNVAFLEQALRRTTATSVGSSHDVFQLQADAIVPRPNIFDQIREQANKVFGFFDQAELQQNLLASQIDGLTDILRIADRDVQALQDPSNFAITYALQDLLAATLELARDVTQQQGEARIYVLPQTMTVMQISVAIYGDTTHYQDIVNNNTIPDLYEVPAGTQIVYFAGGLLNAA
jgi:hypothetical protein